jgi:hypothetical protein
MTTSSVSKLFYNIIGKPFYNFINNNISNKKLFLIIIGSILSISLISIISYYYYLLFYFFITIKTLLYLITSYKPSKNCDENKPNEIIEYLIISIFMNFIYPFTFIPFVWVFGYLLMIIIGISGLASRTYRQKMIFFVAELLKSKSEEKNELQLILENLIYSIININKSAFNMTYDINNLLDKLNFTDNIEDGIASMISTDKDEQDNDEQDNDEQDNDKND